MIKTLIDIIIRNENKKNAKLHMCRENNNKTQISCYVSHSSLHIRLI